MNVFLTPVCQCTVFLNYISYELTFYADYANGYAIEATNDNGIHVLPMTMTICTIRQIIQQALNDEL